MPVAVLAGQSEHGQSGEVDGCGEELEVGSDFGLAAHAGASAAVFAAREVTDFALDGGASGLVVGGPVGSTWLLHAWSSRARAVAAFLSDAVATQSGSEIAGFVPLREPTRVISDFRFGASASRNLASTWPGRMLEFRA